ncbi:MAG: zinc ribbon-containing protein [Methylococcales bacterium]|nr:zinc ribbon-containing protein [Methylococcales bacterium]
MSDDKFTDAYDSLMEHLYEIMDDTLHSIADGLEIAKEKTSELGGLTQEEVNEVADFLKRDIEHAASDTNASLSDWFKFDIEMLENFALDTFKSLADKTRLELTKIERQANKYHPYKSGDVVSPGTFVCDKCNKELAFKSTSTLPDCPECETKSFTRS